MTTAIRWGAVVAWMGVIFFFSAQSGGESAVLSTRVAELFAQVFPGHDPHLLGLLVRKGAHVTEYAILGSLLAWAWQVRPAPGSPRSMPISPALIGPVLVGVAYAASDELHQLLVPGRAGQFTDVLIDTVGVVLGVLLVAALRRRRSRTLRVTPGRGGADGSYRNRTGRRRTSPGASRGRSAWPPRPGRP